MKFLFTINEKYVEQIKILMYSIYANVGEKNLFYFIYKDISETKRMELKEYACNKCNSMVIFIEFPYDDIVGKLPIQGSWSPEIYYRLFAPYILSEVEQVVYLDGDTIVNGNIQDLETLFDSKEGVIAAVPNDVQEVHKARLHLGKENVYINSGVMVINFKEWRARYCLSDVSNILLQMKDRLKFPDQDFINVIWKDYIVILDKKYNYMVNLTECSENYAAIRDPKVCHYVLTKPWVDYFSYKTDKFYLKYMWKSGNHIEALKLFCKHRVLRVKIKLKKFLLRIEKGNMR